MGQAMHLWNSGSSRGGGALCHIDGPTRYRMCECACLLNTSYRTRYRTHLTCIHACLPYEVPHGFVQASPTHNQHTCVRACLSYTRKAAAGWNCLPVLHTYSCPTLVLRLVSPTLACPTHVQLQQGGNGTVKRVAQGLEVRAAFIKMNHNEW